jgi:hypothetical protein
MVLMTVFVESPRRSSYIWMVTEIWNGILQRQQRNGLQRNRRRTNTQMKFCKRMETKSCLYGLETFLIRVRDKLCLWDAEIRCLNSECCYWKIPSISLKHVCTYVESPYRCKILVLRGEKNANTHTQTHKGKEVLKKLIRLISSHCLATSYIVYKYMLLHKTTELCTEWFRVCPTISTKFLTTANLRQIK